ncbi:hypothetical protein J437_LFUL015498 [Ladona fulva]|uniref:rRNA methyltransferase 2, mitochondrial n=1 Tax=Ladona fulva TaxID=123851 RepID=A0A8K0KJH8_LADFU|nr:hypothetical protein J437_LFUL015498 [Ladona fulva]
MNPLAPICNPKYSIPRMIGRIIVNHFHHSCRLNAKSKIQSSHEWILRQKKDPYVEKARVMNYRCRSAFKLLEMDERYRFLYPGQCVVECGAAPGSWTQVLVSKTNSDRKDGGKPVGQVISVDRLPLYHVEGATLLGGSDFTDKAVQQHITELLGNGKADAVLSDMAPNATGVKELDHESIAQLAYSVLKFAVKISRAASKTVCLIKVWDGGRSKQLQTEMQRFYKQVRTVKPSASRMNSAEIYLLGIGFRGLLKKDACSQQNIS